jgi:hypothetical protein
MELGMQDSRQSAGSEKRFGGADGAMAAVESGETGGISGVELLLLFREIVENFFFFWDLMMAGSGWLAEPRMRKLPRTMIWAPLGAEFVEQLEKGGRQSEAEEEEEGCSNKVLEI